MITNSKDYRSSAIRTSFEVSISQNCSFRVRAAPSSTGHDALIKLAYPGWFKILLQGPERLAFHLKLESRIVEWNHV